MNFKLGIIGLPNVGKSTLFNKITRLSIATGNFPFCTIEPNIGVVQVIDSRIRNLSNIIKPINITPASVEFIDVAGLIKGSSKGRGLGNCFLAKIRETKVIVHVVRCFENNNVIHVSGEINPKRDIEEVNNELLFSDLEICERAIYKIHKKFKFSNKKKDIEMKISILEKCLSHLTNSGMLRTLNLSNYEKSIIDQFNFLTIKPTMYIANINKNDIYGDYYLDEVKNAAKHENIIVITICDLLEIENNLYKNNFIKNNHNNIYFDQITSSLNQIINTGFNLLNLKTYFTICNNKLRAWTIPMNFTAIQAANKIHTDFKKKFIRAQVISYLDFINYKGEQASKEAGKVHFKGKNYLVKDGDIINFIIKKR